jgi:hypothetical protein
MKYMMHIKHFKMNNNSIFSDTFMQFLCIIYAFYARFMHVFYAHFESFVKVFYITHYESDRNITGIWGYRAVKA